MTEKNKRRPLGPDGKEREWTKNERFQLYRAGFRDGAAGHTKDRVKEGLGAYDRGYEDGVAARTRAVNNYCLEIGYTPSILRGLK